MLNQELKRYRLDASNDFERSRLKAVGQSLWAWLTRRNNQLLAWADIAPYVPQQRLYRGIREIPLEQIAGSVNRHQEFNRRFEPLRDSLRERWVNIQVLAQTTGWPPIQVFKVGNLYFVEDGHHRVSVARWLGNRHIEAEVWEYPASLTLPPNATTAEVVGRLKRKPLPAHPESEPAPRCCQPCAVCPAS